MRLGLVAGPWLSRTSDKVLINYYYLLITILDKFEKNFADLLFPLASRTDAEEI
jgi:hypothetical protein